MDISVLNAQIIFPIILNKRCTFLKTASRGKINPHLEVKEKCQINLIFASGFCDHKFSNFDR
jgi:hypothetical protein